MIGRRASRGLLPAAARAAVVHDLADEVVEQRLEIPVLFPEDVVVTSPRVVGSEPRLVHRPGFRGVGVR
ncbi:hypothetical protein [Pseudonocardia pini]|uniref:hypothetical protein n=1 Tax=Pseudonocardia pini TaxID=2758030 RepID=UPI0015F07CA9|nr:hypothetical protein [Pseudonocardia pini]